jgi:cyclohexyl-isocyanide hydratase
MDRGSHEAAYTIYIDRQLVQFTGFLVVSGDTAFCGTVAAILGGPGPAGEETINMVAGGDHLEIGSLLFEGLDQIDLTGPFEVLSRLPNSTLRLYGKTLAPVRDVQGLRLTPDATLAEAPQLDVLHVPGGFGQEALMDDAETLGWIARQAAGARCIFSVCTGALLCGAAGLLKVRRATTHWSAHLLLPLFGAVPVDARVVVDGKLVCAAGVTAGIDGALRVAAELRGDDAARAIQLFMQYAPEPPFDSGSPATASPHVLEDARRAVEAITRQREATARRVAQRLGTPV